MLLRSAGEATPPLEPSALPSSLPPNLCLDDGRPSNLRELVALLVSPSGLRLFKKAFRENMLYKVAKYTELLDKAERAVAAALDVVDLKMPDLKRAARLPPEDAADNWHIFQTISGPYQAAKDQASQFQAVLNRAKDRLSGSMAVEKVVQEDVAKDLRDELVVALEHLSNFSAQAHLVAKVTDVVASFLKDPRLFRTRLLNFVLMGGPGTGKTTLAEAIGDVLAKAGLFVGNELVEAGRGELVGQYMGETVAKTRHFLVSHLDRGVVFVDEAYAITPWEDGKPESYGTEAATAMVEFMTRFPGLYCIITAGYEREMMRYFLPANEGLSRRFPYKFVLHDMTPSELVRVFQRHLLHAQGLPVPNGRDAPLASAKYFSAAAYAWLERLVHVAMQGDVTYEEERDTATRRVYSRVRRFHPRWDCLHRLFEHQAGSMTNLADEAVTVLYTTIRFSDVIAARRRRHARPPIREQGLEVMREVVVQRIGSMALSDAEAFLRQLDLVEPLLLLTPPHPRHPLGHPPPPPPPLADSPHHSAPPHS